MACVSYEVRKDVAVTGPVVVAEVVRSGFVECSHYGSVVLTAPNGAVEWSAGVPDEPMFPRSANKPMQALGMARAGLTLDGELLALTASSHAGEPFHVDGVRDILARAGLDESALQNPKANPLDRAARRSWRLAGNPKARVTMNCSGKHAAMLMTCVINGWPTDTYRDPAHPLQQEIRTAVQDCSGEKVAAVGVDGCGAPLLAISLAGLARSFGHFASAEAGTHEGRVARAYRAHPQYVSGSRRLSMRLMRAVPGLICKTGAEGVFAAGLPDGRGLAVKINDGAPRARLVVFLAALRRMGVGHELLRSRGEPPILGGGEPVGMVRAGRAIATN
jgi:L-asparaginase II